eukprot:scaffold3455_cov213-Prasinococcus_capsulatus_cf.AAC.8
MARGRRPGILTSRCELAISDPHRRDSCREGFRATAHVRSASEIAATSKRSYHELQGSQAAELPHH